MYLKSFHLFATRCADACCPLCAVSKRLCKVWCSVLLYIFCYWTWNLWPRKPPVSGINLCYCLQTVFELKFVVSEVWEDPSHVRILFQTGPSTTWPQWKIGYLGEKKNQSRNSVSFDVLVYVNCLFTLSYQTTMREASKLVAHSTGSLCWPGLLTSRGISVDSWSLHGEDIISIDHAHFQVQTNHNNWPHKKTFSSGMQEPKPCENNVLFSLLWEQFSVLEE